MDVAVGVLIAAGAMLAGTIVVAVFDPDLDTPAARNAAQLVVAVSLAGTALGFALADAGGRLKAAFAKLNAAILDEAWVISIAYRQSVFGLAKHVDGFAFTVDDMPVLENVSLEK